jgi:hypothetical protein
MTASFSQAEMAWRSFGVWLILTSSVSTIFFLIAAMLVSLYHEEAGCPHESCSLSETAGFTCFSLTLGVVMATLPLAATWALF